MVKHRIESHKRTFSRCLWGFPHPRVLWFSEEGFGLPCYTRRREAYQGRCPLNENNEDLFLVVS